MPAAARIPDSIHPWSLSGRNIPPECHLAGPALTSAREVEVHWLIVREIGLAQTPKHDGFAKRSHFT